MNNEEEENEDGLLYRYFIKPFEYGGDAATANATTTAEKTPMTGTPDKTVTAGDDAAAGDDDVEEAAEGDDDEEATEGDDDDEEYVY